MAAPSDPEKYSLDDMMDRLKNRPDEEPIENGELITRTDGSQAIRGCSGAGSRRISELL